MKVFVHIKNDGYFCHRAVSVAVDLECRPNVGDYFYLTEDLRQKLEETRNMYPAADEANTTYDEWRFGSEGQRYYSFEEAIKITDAAFCPDEKGNYNLHIELGDD